MPETRTQQKHFANTTQVLGKSLTPLSDSVRPRSTETKVDADETAAHQAGSS